MTATKKSVRFSDDLLVALVEPIEDVKQDLYWNAKEINDMKHSAKLAATLAAQTRQQDAEAIDEIYTTALELSTKLSDFDYTRTLDSDATCFEFALPLIAWCNNGDERGLERHAALRYRTERSVCVKQARKVVVTMSQASQDADTIALTYHQYTRAFTAFARIGAAADELVCMEEIERLHCFQQALNDRAVQRDDDARSQHSSCDSSVDETTAATRVGRSATRKSMLGRVRKLSKSSLDATAQPKTKRRIGKGLYRYLQSKLMPAQ